MNSCSVCKKKINTFPPWECKNCGKFHCTEHRMPEEHKCYKIFSKDFFKPLNNKILRKEKKEIFSSGENLFIWALLFLIILFLFILF